MICYNCQQEKRHGYEAVQFANAARLYAGTNPGFFKGTRVEDAVADLLRGHSLQFGQSKAMAVGWSRAMGGVLAADAASGGAFALSARGLGVAADHRHACPRSRTLSRRAAGGLSARLG